MKILFGLGYYSRLDSFNGICESIEYKKIEQFKGVTLFPVSESLSKSFRIV